MDKKSCNCGGKEGEPCPVCGAGDTLPYWCEVCRRAVAQKRCPSCGLKARKLKAGG
ncbi:MAG: hypothetical protein HYV06_08425 [Deltaproteobacteria bacterium]|nr:hypothetical protein [Deltaproteobacteria bacterium]